MEKKSLRIFGTFLFLVGIVFLLNSISIITGYFIFEEVDEDFNRAIGLVFLLLGLIIFLSGLENKVEKLKRELAEILKSSKIGSYDELTKIAQKMGYGIKEGGNHSKIYRGDKFVTTIPRHARGVATGTYRSIVKELYSNAA